LVAEEFDLQVTRQQLAATGGDNMFILVNGRYGLAPWENVVMFAPASIQPSIPATALNIDKTEVTMGVKFHANPTPFNATTAITVASDSAIAAEYVHINQQTREVVVSTSAPSSGTLKLEAGTGVTASIEVI